MSQNIFSNDQYMTVQNMLEMRVKLKDCRLVAQSALMFATNGVIIGRCRAAVLYLTCHTLEYLSSCCVTHLVMWYNFFDVETLWRTYVWGGACDTTERLRHWKDVAERQLSLDRYHALSIVRCPPCLSISYARLEKAITWILNAPYFSVYTLQHVHELSVVHSNATISYTSK